MLNWGHGICISDLGYYDVPAIKDVLAYLIKAIFMWFDIYYELILFLRNYSMRFSYARVASSRCFHQR